MRKQPADRGGLEPSGSAGQTLGATFGVGVLSLAVLHGAAAVLDLVLPTPAFREAQAATAATACLLLAAIDLWHRAWGLPGLLVPHAAGLVTAVAAWSAAVHLVLSTDVLQAMYLMLIVVASGAVLPSRGWLLAVEAISLAGLLIAGTPHAAEPAWQHVAVVLLFSLAVAHLLQQMQRRAHRRLDQVTAALAAQASRDALTGLLNRRGLQQAAADLLGQRAAQPGQADPGAGPAAPCAPRRPLAADHVVDRAADLGAGTGTGALYLDVDGFKQINDELGHAAGDAVLVEVADRLASLVRAGDLVARVGGDEFVALLPGVDAAQLAQLGHRARIRLTGTAGVLQLPWSVSVGTALSAPAATAADPDCTTLLRTADLAMYQDKQTRRAASPPQHPAAAPRRARQHTRPGTATALP